MDPCWLLSVQMFDNTLGVILDIVVFLRNVEEEGSNINYCKNCSYLYDSSQSDTQSAWHDCSISAAKCTTGTFNLPYITSYYIPKHLL